MIAELLCRIDSVTAITFFVLLEQIIVNGDIECIPVCTDEDRNKCERDCKSSEGREICVRNSCGTAVPSSSVAAIRESNCEFNEV